MWESDRQMRNQNNITPLLKIGWKILLSLQWDTFSVQQAVFLSQNTWCSGSELWSGLTEGLLKWLLIKRHFLTGILTSPMWQASTLWSEFSSLKSHHWIEPPVVTDSGTWKYLVVKKLQPHCVYAIPQMKPEENCWIYEQWPGSKSKNNYLTLFPKHKLQVSSPV